MSLGSLSNSELRTLDYVLNYTPSERIETVLDEEISEDLKESIDREVRTDDYSNRYEVLQVDEDVRDEAIQLIDDRFDDLYTDRIGDALEELFNARPHDAFQFYSDVSSEDGLQSDDEKSIQPYEGDYNNLMSLFQDLYEIGVGFRRLYLTTTDNYYQQFEFRTQPIDGLQVFLDTAEVLVKDQLKDLDPAERWAAYLHAYLNSSNRLDNLNGYSRSQIEAALERPQVTAKENITFLNEEIKNHLKGKLQEAVERDTYYLTVMEFLLAVSPEQSRQDASYRSFDVSMLENLANRSADELESYIEQLHEEGLLLAENDQYILTEEVLALLDEVEDRSKIESYPIETLEDACNILYQIFGQAAEEIKIIDPYFTRDALRLVESNVPNDVEIRVLYSDDVNEDDEDQLKSELNERTVDDSKYDIKKMQPPSQEGVPHDRFIIIDNYKVWQVGHSFNGLGTDFSTIFSHSEKESPRYVRLFDDLWQNGEELSW